MCVALLPSVPERGGLGSACLGLVVALPAVPRLCGVEAVSVVGLPLILSTTEQLVPCLLCASV